MAVTNHDQASNIGNRQCSYCMGFGIANVQIFAKRWRKIMWGNLHHVSSPQCFQRYSKPTRFQPTWYGMAKLREETCEAYYKRVEEMVFVLLPGCVAAGVAARIPQCRTRQSVCNSRFTCKRYPLGSLQIMVRTARYVTINLPYLMQ